jgi:hypothetical protein
VVAVGFRNDASSGFLLGMAAERIVSGPSESMSARGWSRSCRHTPTGAVIAQGVELKIGKWPPRFVDTDYHSPELRLSLAKEWRDRSGGGTHTHRYDRIYSLKPGRAARGRSMGETNAETLRQSCTASAAFAHLSPYRPATPAAP